MCWVTLSFEYCNDQKQWKYPYGKEQAHVGPNAVGRLMAIVNDKSYVKMVVAEQGLAGILQFEISGGLKLRTFRASMAKFAYCQKNCRSTEI